MKCWITIGATAAAAAGSVALVGCGTPSNPVSAPPAELIGTWNGGAGGSNDWRLTISSDDSYTLINDRLGLSDYGQVDASNHGFSGTGDARVLEAAGISGCDWRIENSQDQVGDLYGYAFASLVFCDNATSAWVRF